MHEIDLGLFINFFILINDTDVDIIRNNRLSALQRVPWCNFVKCFSKLL